MKNQYFYVIWRWNRIDGDQWLVCSYETRTVAIRAKSSAQANKIADKLNAALAELT